MRVIVKNPNDLVMAYANKKFRGNYKINENTLFMRVSTIDRAFKVSKTLKLLSPDSLVKILIP